MKTTSLHKKLLSVIALITLSQLVGCSGTAVKEMTDGTEGRYELSKKLDRSGISDRFEIVHVTFQNQNLNSHYHQHKAKQKGDSLTPKLTLVMLSRLLSFLTIETSKVRLSTTEQK